MLCLLFVAAMKSKTNYFNLQGLISTVHYYFSKHCSKEFTNMYFFTYLSKVHGVLQNLYGLINYFAMV